VPGGELAVIWYPGGRDLRGFVAEHHGARLGQRHGIQVALKPDDTVSFAATVAVRPDRNRPGTPADTPGAVVYLTPVSNLRPRSSRNAPAASAGRAWSFVRFRCLSTYCAELIHKHGQALVVEGWAQPPGPGECRQAVKTAPGDLGERLCVAVASQRGQRLT